MRRLLASLATSALAVTLVAGSYGTAFAEDWPGNPGGSPYKKAEAAGPPLPSAGENSVCRTYSIVWQNTANGKVYGGGKVVCKKKIKHLVIYNGLGRLKPHKQDTGNRDCWDKTYCFGDKTELSDDLSGNQTFCATAFVTINIEDNPHTPSKACITT